MERQEHSQRQSRQAMEKERDVAARRDPYFDYAEALLQIAIVLASVSVITAMRPLTIGAGLVGLAAALHGAAVWLHII